MKKTIALIIGVMLIANVLAQEELPGAGITPDHWAYGFEKLFERIRLFLTFDPEARARFRLQLAGERLSEAREMVKRNRTEFVESLMKEYEAGVGETERDINASIALGRNVTALAEHVSNMTYKHIEVLQEVLEKVPEKARIHMEHAINVSIHGHETAVERILSRINKTMEEMRKFNCTVDVDCRHLICPMAIGMDTPICEEGKCKCGGKWEMINKTEWRERFKEELTNETKERMKKIEEMYNRTEIGIGRGRK